jgi:TRAP-type C4-dicarboxylate transport system permease small subunit
MPDEQGSSLTRKLKKSTGGAVGAGLVLVVLPCIALYFGMSKMGAAPLVGLPLLAILGIMILFGSLALTSTLFARLGLDDRSEALALPNGSVRAAIAMSLIVLFAIIAIMLHQSVADPYKIGGLTEAEKGLMVRDLAGRVIAVKREPCPEAKAPTGAASGSTPAEPAACEPRFEVHLVPPRGQESTELAKQLLVLIGTLMTSVTSFYFAARTSESATKGEMPSSAREQTASAQALPAAGGEQSHAHTHAGASDDDHKDGCDVAIADPTPDEELPPSKGGVA